MRRDSPAASRIAEIIETPKIRFLAPEPDYRAAIGNHPVGKTELVAFAPANAAIRPECDLKSYQVKM
jgi:hypothetical protein